MPKVVPASPYSFSKQHRLLSKDDFQSVFDHSKKIKYKSLLVFYMPNLLGHPRLGVIIPKHLHPRAIDRNRIRRLIRESFRLILDKLPADDFVILLKSKLLKQDLAEFKGTELWEKFIIKARDLPGIKRIKHNDAWK